LFRGTILFKYSCITSTVLASTSIKNSTDAYRSCGHSHKKCTHRQWNKLTLCTLCLKILTVCTPSECLTMWINHLFNCSSSSNIKRLKYRLPVSDDSSTTNVAASARGTNGFRLLKLTC